MPKGDLLGTPDSSKDAEGDSDSSIDAAKDVLEAIADKDASALDLALKRHYEMCESDDEDDSDEE